MSHSPFANRSKALTFVVLTVLGGLALADTVDDVSVAPSAGEPETEAPAPEPMATVAAVTTSAPLEEWNDSGVDDNEPSVDIEIADYQPPARAQANPADQGHIHPDGLRPIARSEMRTAS